MHFVWKYKKLPLNNMVTTGNEVLLIEDVGLHNHQSGPDFFNAKIKIGNQLWAGNVEIHINSSDWYAHKHELDTNYDNVILHVVWNYDMAVSRKDSSEIPTLELNNYISKELLKNYQGLFAQRSNKFINCEKELANIDGFIIDNWLERLYVERLEAKSELINELLEASKNDWEKVLFTLLLKNFGLNINGDAFLSLAKALDFSIVRKLQRSPIQLECILFGLGGLLDDSSVHDPYYTALKTEYGYLQKKFSLNKEAVQKPEFFKLRPANFPTIRLSQLANLYRKHLNLFHLAISATSLQHLYSILDISASTYWDDHYTFGKESRKSKKILTKKFKDLLIINTILPVKFCYSKHLGTPTKEGIFKIIEGIGKEDNSVIGKFNRLGLKTKSAGDSQAVLQLYNGYCSNNKCLQCAIGGHLLNGNI